MPSVNSIVSQANMVAQMSTKYFGSNIQAANNSVLVEPGYKSFFNFLKSEFGGQPALTNLIENYTANRKSFKDEMQENLNSLKESTDKVKESAKAEEVSKPAKTEEIVDTDNDHNTGSTLSTLGEFAVGNIPPEQRNAPPKPNKSTQPEPPEPVNSLQDFANVYLTADKIRSDILENISNTNGNSRISEIQNLVHDFNSAIAYLYENRGVSNLMGALADKFGNNQNLSASLSSIGISVNAQGFLSVNEAIFNSALNNDSESVNNILGSEGLAGQLDKNINLANYQGDKLFTSILDFATQNSQDDSESLYGNNANYAKENTPRIFAMLT
jgi:flagellar hook-associated protein 2